ncbi:MAG: heparan-alpha-glucosaminide N-acetyltransferase domain-containing protein [Blastocatellia bacterium]|nr:heparan-alpha-glucosaminide N-acetyltransferase domain-containing protein [Blastocatellia bacterium]
MSTATEAHTIEEATDLAADKALDARAERLLSLDALRGITVAAMILVNNPGTWGAVYAPLRHAEWHGWTPTDLIFPFFLFIVGVSIALALARRNQYPNREGGGSSSGGAQRDLFLKIIKRAIIIFALGLIIYGFPYYQLSTIRIPGVLQRIAVCYLIASIIFLKTRWRTQAIIASALLLVYWLVMILAPVPVLGAGDLSKEGNFAAYIDRLLMPGHLWTPVYDPEGLLSTVPAIATTLFGVLAGQWMQSRRAAMEKVAGLFIVGAFAIIIGWAWGGLFPINKALWTSSYTVFTAGMALQFLGLFYWLIDVKGFRRAAAPFVIFGVNALAVYALSSMVAIAIDTWNVAGRSGSPETIKEFSYNLIFASWASPVNASLLWAFSYVLIWFGLAALLYWRRIFIKV